MFTRDVPSGTGARLISSVSPEHALDELVELMRRQVPGDRPGTISDVKKQIAGRAHEAIVFQRLNALRTAVVPATSADVPPPVQVVGVDYNVQGQGYSSQGPELVFILEPKPSRMDVNIQFSWSAHEHNEHPQPRS